MYRTDETYRKGEHKMLTKQEREQKELERIAAYRAQMAAERAKAEAARAVLEARMADKAQIINLTEYDHEIAGRVNLVAFADSELLTKIGIAYYLSGVGTVVDRSIVDRIGMNFTLAQAEEIGEIIRQQKERREAILSGRLVKCDCGHFCDRAQRMSTSRGTSCPDCYDRMSE
jgi:hypothetical protein